MNKLKEAGILVFKVVTICLIASACAVNEAINPPPSIVVNSQDPQQWDSCISGKVIGAESQHFFIAIYMEIDGRWYTLSGIESMQILIDENQNWSCPIQSSRKSIIDKIQIFLFPAGFDADRLAGEKIIPLRFHLAATAKLSVEMKHL